MHRLDFDYDLPQQLIAQTPLPERSASRLLVLPGVEGGDDRRARDAPDCQDSSCRDLPHYLRPGDLLVFNDTRVVPARLKGTKSSGGRVEILLERALADGEALVQLRASKPLRAGLEINTAGGILRLLGREADLWRIALPQPALEFFGRWGEVPLPPYIRRAVEAADRERYQSIFAREPGAVAAPTASLHFDAPLLAALEARGVVSTCITLHVGAGTFQPLRNDTLAAHVMHPERVTVDAAACEAIIRARAHGGRIVAVGTTVARALESAALAAAGHDPADPAAASAAGGTEAAGAGRPATRGAALAPWSGETRLFITPGFTWRVCDLLFTNFHLPQSTLLMLVCAFAGTSRVLSAYAHAVRARYRFFSYGDAMLAAREPA
ncbi:MAG: tRNA preQ1(34) S-adenosylmethionine ribosyltransferase-isomerase QueA [Proteobacteria bacterium]|nr:tRNA preQ1(34) S-adenosylmethionine ribosyltransferase-isomerase QueA [Pseudomonadota bacterium]